MRLVPSHNNIQPLNEINIIKTCHESTLYFHIELNDITINKKAVLCKKPFYINYIYPWYNEATETQYNYINTQNIINININTQNKSLL